MEAEPRPTEQVEAMISLLFDRSEKVVRTCHQALVENAGLAEPLLRDRLRRAPRQQQPRLRRVLIDVTGVRLEDPIVAHITTEPELEAGSTLIGRLVSSGSTSDAVRPAIDAMAEAVQGQLVGAGEPDRQLAVMIDVLVRQNDLRGADPKSASLAEATLTEVLVRRRGLPLPLCIIWILVARRVGIPIEGLNMPAHFLLRHHHPEGMRILDAFHGGRVVREEDCRRFLASAGFPDTDLEPLRATDREMLLRTLRNLAMIAGRKGRRYLAASCGRILTRTGELADT